MRRARCSASCARSLLRSGLRRSSAQESERRRREHGCPGESATSPYLAAASNDGPVLAFRVHHFQPRRVRSPVTATRPRSTPASGSPPRQPLRRRQVPRAPAGRTGGSRAGSRAERQARFGYFGLGNETEKDDDLVTGGQSLPLPGPARPATAARWRSPARSGGRCSVALQANVEWTRFTVSPGTLTFHERLRGRGRGDRRSRAASRWSTTPGTTSTTPTRDSCSRRVRRRAAAATATPGSTPCSGATCRFGRAPSSPRGSSRRAWAALPLSTRATHSRRGRSRYRCWAGSIPTARFDTGRFAGQALLLGNLEVRHDLLPFGDLGAITLLAFLDAGRVFEQESFKLTTEE